MMQIVGSANFMTSQGHCHHKRNKNKKKKTTHNQIFKGPAKIDRQRQRGIGVMCVACCVCVLRVYVRMTNLLLSLDLNKQ